MIIKLCAVDLIDKSKIAETNKQFKKADEFAKLAHSILFPRTFIFSQYEAPKMEELNAGSIKQDGYIKDQRSTEQAVNQAAMAWAEYIGNLFSRIPQASGPDAAAIADYAVDIQRKQQALIGATENLENKAKSQIRQFDTMRKVEPLSTGTWMENAGLSGAHGSLGLGNAAGNAAQATRAGWQQAKQTGKQTLQQMRGMTKSVYPGSTIFAPISRANYQNQGITGQQMLSNTGVIQGTPFNLTTEQVLGTGKGKYAPTREDIAARHHPAMIDPAFNSKGFKAMEEAWKVYFYQYLPKYGISSGQTTSSGGIQSTFAENSKRKINAAATVPPKNVAPATPSALPPVPALTPPNGKSWRSSLGLKGSSGENIAAEKSFFKNIFVEVEKRMMGEQGEGATLKGVVKKGAIRWADAQTSNEIFTSEMEGNVASGVASPVALGIGQGAMGMGWDAVARPLVGGRVNTII